MFFRKYGKTMPRAKLVALEQKAAVGKYLTESLELIYPALCSDSKLLISILLAAIAKNIINRPFKQFSFSLLRDYTLIH